MVDHFSQDFTDGVDFTNITPILKEENVIQPHKETIVTLMKENGQNYLTIMKLLKKLVALLSKKFQLVNSNYD